MRTMIRYLQLADEWDSANLDERMYYAHEARIHDGLDSTFFQLRPENQDRLYRYFFSL